MIFTMSIFRLDTMNFGKLANTKKRAIADEVFEWYEKKYQIEIPPQEKQEFQVCWTMKILSSETMK